MTFSRAVVLGECGSRAKYGGREATKMIKFYLRKKRGRIQDKCFSKALPLSVTLREGRNQTLGRKKNGNIY